jgi:ParB family transcriptional regulator, chromosome partitioning protein
VKPYEDSIFWVDINRVSPNPFQPRREFDEGRLRELAESIRQYGLLQPLTVTRKETTQTDGSLIAEYELIAGERRLRASKLAGFPKVPVIIRIGEESDQVKLELAIIENLQREDLNPIDRAQALRQLVDKFSFTHSEVGKKIGKSREYVSNTLRMLGLPEDMQRSVVAKELVEGHARSLLMLSGKDEEQRALYKDILLRKLSTRDAELAARRAAQDRVRAKHLLSPEMLDFERQLTETLGTKVQIEPKDSGGRVVINFFSPEDLAAILVVVGERQQLKDKDLSGGVENGEEIALSEDGVQINEGYGGEGGNDENNENEEQADEDLYSMRNFSI